MTKEIKDYSSLHQAFLDAAHTKGLEKPFLWSKKDNDSPYTSISFGQVIENASGIAAWLIENGCGKGDRIALITDNCPEFVMIDQALQQTGMVNVSVYPTLAENEISYILNDSWAKMIFIGSPFLYRKIQKIRGSLSGIQKVVTLYELPDKEPGSTDFTSVLQEGKALLPEHKAHIDRLSLQVEQEDLTTLVYTSGTTGVPKGVMLTHRNFLGNVWAAKKLLYVLDENEKLLSFLPLSHVYERLVYNLACCMGLEVAYAQSIDTIAKNITEVKPTIIPTVPRLLERIHDRVIKNAEQQGAVKSKIFKWALDLGYKAQALRDKEESPGFGLKAQLAIAEKLVFSTIKEKLGGKVKLIVSGGAAMPPHVGLFFAALGITVVEGYGLTETSPFICVNEPHRQLIGTVGRIAPGQEVAIQNIENGQLYTTQTFETLDPHFESPEGEILVRGINVMKGYWNKQDETQKVFDHEGWFHTGDVGHFHKGYLKITDRIKNMLVNSFGKNIYPTPVENIYLKSPKIEQIFLIGDKREYVTALIYPNKEEMTEKFHLSEDFFQQQDPFITDQAILDWLEYDIRKLGNELSKFERIKDFLVKRHPFSIETGELTPSQKVKRKLIEERYKPSIDHMYAEKQIIEE